MISRLALVTILLVSAVALPQTRPAETAMDTARNSRGNAREKALKELFATRSGMTKVATLVTDDDRELADAVWRKLTQVIMASQRSPVTSRASAAELAALREWAAKALPTIIEQRSASILDSDGATTLSYYGYSEAAVAFYLGQHAKAVADQKGGIAKAFSAYCLGCATKTHSPFFFGLAFSKERGELEAADYYMRSVRDPDLLMDVLRAHERIGSQFLYSAIRAAPSTAEAIELLQKTRRHENESVRLLSLDKLYELRALSKEQVVSDWSASKTVREAKDYGPLLQRIWSKPSEKLAMLESPATDQAKAGAMSLIGSSSAELLRIKHLRIIEQIAKSSDRPTRERAQELQQHLHVSGPIRSAEDQVSGKGANPSELDRLPLLLMRGEYKVNCPPGQALQSAPQPAPPEQGLSLPSWALWILTGASAVLATAIVTIRRLPL